MYITWFLIKNTLLPKHSNHIIWAQWVIISSLVESLTFNLFKKIIYIYLWSSVKISRRERGVHVRNDKSYIHQEQIILNVCAPHNRAAECMEPRLAERRGETHRSAITAGPWPLPSQQWLGPPVRKSAVTQNNWATHSTDRLINLHGAPHPHKQNTRPL